MSETAGGRSQRIGADVHAGAPVEEAARPGVDPGAFRDALARWASGVAVAALREDGRVIATTVSSLMSIAVDPPLIALAIGPTAQVQPFLTPGRRFGVSILAEGQRRVAADLADAYPVGPDPFAPKGEPVVEGALVALVCRVERADPAGDHRIVVALVEDVRPAGEEPLVRFGRAYRRLAP